MVILKLCMVIFIKKLPKKDVQKFIPKLAHICFRKRQNFWGDYGKSFISILENNQVWKCQETKNLGNVPELSFQLRFPVIGQKISGFYLVQKGGSPRKECWDLMIHITVTIPKEIWSFLSTESKIFSWSL